MSAGEDLQNETAVVTGAASGIGEGTARCAASLGMRVVLADLVRDRLEQVTQELRVDGADAVAVPTDVRDPDALERLAEVAYEGVGSVRLLVNNAGVEATGYSWEMVPRAWEQVIRVNLLGVFHGVWAFVPRMLAQGSPAGIINLSSIAALSSGPPQQSAYNASKHGVQALSECLALELLEVGAPVTVHVVNPGPVKTRIFTDAAAEGEKAAAARSTYDDFVSDEGLTGLEAGELIIEGFRRGEFWIRTHPEMQDDAVARRAQMLTQRTPPGLVTLDTLQDL